MNNSEGLENRHPVQTTPSPPTPLTPANGGRERDRQRDVGSVDGGRGWLWGSYVPHGDFQQRHHWDTIP